ncbi:ABC-three component system middle component 6 [Herbivorax sp. ANBcel31]|uniref:ABC-three component system middle component 6 n=1 Tax=Herbivorax sp. ANBcel31 TaxID=3069754 RepID=UPI0027D3253D|nr:ABC-three component system middle component 6 [Herbivorax sp. ANBcel31]
MYFQMKGMSIMVTNKNNLNSSILYIGYLILKEIKKLNTTKISLYDVSAILKKNGISSSRQLILGLSFLYSLGIIEFEEANVCIKK